MKNDTKYNRITTANYDMRAHSIWRTFRQDLRFRYLPIGFFGGGPNLFYIARLILLHTLGWVMMGLYMRSGLVRHFVKKFAGPSRSS